MINSNCHTHTTFCDGKNTADEMAQAALGLGFVSLGFSGHSPMTIENDYAIRPENFSSYIETIEKTRAKYEGRLEIYNGLELDADHSDFDRKKFDYIIGSVHQLHCGGRVYSIDDTAEELQTCVETEFDGSWNAMAKQYYSSVAKFIIEVKPDIVGHFDLIEKFNDNGRLFDSDNAEYKLIVKTYLERICYACPDVIFEVNTGAMSRLGNKTPYPGTYILKLLKKMGMKITITSDAHSVETLNFAFDKAASYCMDCGYDEAYILRGGKFQSIAFK